ncbi:hypothetical protein SSTU70S_04697 [Stutzerimonas stutzeri]
MRVLAPRLIVSSGATWGWACWMLLPANQLATALRGSNLGPRPGHRSPAATGQTLHRHNGPADHAARHGGAAQGLANIFQAIVAAHMTIVIVVLLEVVDIQQDQRQRLAGALGVAPFHLEAVVEHAPVGHAGKAVLIGEFFQLLLQLQQLLLGLLALADIEHEADQRFDLARGIAQHMHHIANPHIAAVAGQSAIVGLVVDTGLTAPHRNSPPTRGLPGACARPSHWRSANCPAASPAGFRSVGRCRQTSWWPSRSSRSRLGRFQQCLYTSLSFIIEPFIIESCMADNPCWACAGL